MIKLRDILSIFIFICLSVSFSNRVHSQEVNVRTEPDTMTLLIGDQIWFTVTIEKPAGLDLDFPRLRDTLISKIEILRGPLSDTTTLENDKEIIRDRYLITSFDSGRYEIPPFYAELVSDDGIKRFYSGYSYLSVKRPDIAPQDSTMQFFDIIPPYKAPLTLGETLPWLLIILAIVVVAYLIVRYLKSRRKRENGEFSEDPVEAAHIVAYRKLERLKSDKLCQKGEYKEYYTRLSEILRVYIDMRFSMNSMESTTGEILMEIDTFPVVEGEPSDSLRQVLELADMVKFAKYIPDSSDCELSMEQAWSFISMTRKEKTASKEDDGADNVEGGDES
jgi:hypothetical protein